MRRENTQRSILSYKRWVGMNLREIRLQAMLLQDHFDKVRISVTNDLEFAPPSRSQIWWARESPKFSCKFDTRHHFLLHWGHLQAHINILQCSSVAIQLHHHRVHELSPRKNLHQRLHTLHCPQLVNHPCIAIAIDQAPIEVEYNESIHGRVQRSDLTRDTREITDDRDGDPTQNHGHVEFLPAIVHLLELLQHLLTVSPFNSKFQVPTEDECRWTKYHGIADVVVENPPKQVSRIFRRFG